MQPSSFLRRAKKARRRVFCFAGALALGLSYGQAAQAEERTPSSVSVHVERGLLSVDARGAPLGEVLKAIAKQADFQLDTKGDLDIPVTWSFANVPVGEMGASKWPSGRGGSSPKGVSALSASAPISPSGVSIITG